LGFQYLVVPVPSLVIVEVSCVIYLVSPRFELACVADQNVVLVVVAHEKGHITPRAHAAVSPVLLGSYRGIFDGQEEVVLVSLVVVLHEGIQGDIPILCHPQPHEQGPIGLVAPVEEHVGVWCESEFGCVDWDLIDISIFCNCDMSLSEFALIPS